MAAFTENMADIIGMITPDTFAEAVGMERFSRLHKRACLAAVRLTPEPTWAMYGDGSDYLRRERALHGWVRRAVAVRDQFGRRAVAMVG